jgi:phage protein D
MSAVTQPQNLDDTYAPAFQLFLNQKELSPESKGDLLSLKVDLDIENFDRFELTLNNWVEGGIDPNREQPGFKYTGNQPGDKPLIDVGDTILVKLGYQDRLVTVIQGKVQTLAARFPDSGSPTLVVSGLDRLHDLSLHKPEKNEQRNFRGKTDWEIAEVIANRNHLQSEVTKQGPKNGDLWQRDLDDAAFLMERAKKLDFDLFVQPDDSGVDTLYFVKPSRDKGYSFEWGQNLTSFTPTVNAARQMQSVTVRGWNPQSKSVIEYKAEAKDLPEFSGKGSGKSGADIPGRSGDQVVDFPVASKEEAQRLAKSLLADKAYWFVTGEGKVIGVPDLRPAQLIELTGLGPRFSGNYEVRTVSHTFGSNGYTTSFSVRRLYLPGGSS